MQNTVYTSQKDEKMGAPFQKKYCQTALKIGVLVVLTTTILTAVSVFAGTTISAGYTQARGAHIKWKIRVPSPPPAAVIVTQYILPGSDILESSHTLSSYDKEKGVAKWLITPVAPGRLKMEMKISMPIRKKGEIQGEILFKDASQNTTASVFMKPRARRKALEGC